MSKTPLFFVAALAALLLPRAAAAQSYTRPTVTRMVVNHRDSYDTRVARELLDSLPQDAQFFFNKVKTIAVPATKPRDNIIRTSKGTYISNLSKVEMEARKKEFAAYLNGSGVGLQQLGAWFNRQPDGSMNMDLIHFRGEYNATDEALHTVTATKRGREELKDKGEALIANTFLLLYDYNNLQRNVDKSSTSYGATLYLYVYRMAQPNKLINDVYDCWLDEDTPPAEAAKLKARFDSIRVTWEPVEVYAAKGYSTVPSTSLGADDDRQLFAKMVNRAYDKAMKKLGNKDDRFGVQTAVYSVTPITARIGLKEGLKPNQRYFIQETVLKEDGKTKQVRKGVARVNGQKITDNRQITEGNTTPSEYYQISGARIEQGMSLRYKDDIGWALTLGGGASSGGQMLVQARVDWLLKWAKTPNMWSLFVDYEYLQGSYETPLLGEIQYDKLPNFVLKEEYVEGKKRSFSFLRATLGVGRSYQPLRNLQVSPYLGLGYGVSGFATLKDSTYVSEGASTEETNLSTESISIISYHAKVGLNLAVNLYYPLQLVGGAYVYMPYTFTSKGKHEEDEDPLATLRDRKYEEYYKGLKPITVVGFVGLRYTF